MAIGASSAHAATASASASAEILIQVSISKTADLDFGSIAPDDINTDTVQVAANAAGTRTCGTNLTCADSTASAAFEVTGADGLTTDVTLDPSVTLTSGGNSMTATLSGSASTLAMTGSAVDYYVGGELTVTNNQAPGSYSGSFDVTIEYQ
jgi:hypothetical protein